MAVKNLSLLQIEALLQELDDDEIAPELERGIRERIHEALGFFHERAKVLRSLQEEIEIQLRIVNNKIQWLEKSRTPLTDLYVNPDAIKLSNSAVVRLLAREILLEVGHPLSRAELLRRMLDREIELPFANPAKAISKILWASKDFRYTNHGYWVAGEPLEGVSRRRTRFRSKTKEK